MSSFFGGSKDAERNLERALEQAYQAALKIKDIEDEYYNGNKIPTDSRGGGSVPGNLLADFEKNLGTAQLKIAEFKAKASGQGNLNSNQMVKLKFVEGILSKYAGSKGNANTSIVPLSNTNLPAKKINKGQASTSNPTNLTPDSLAQKSGMLPRSIGKTINKIKKELDPNAEQEVIREFRRSRNKTVTAVKFMLTLILVPVLVHFLSKHFIISPILGSISGESSDKVFLNYEMKEKAFSELKTFEEELKFESMIDPKAKLTPEVIEEKVKEKADEIAEESREESRNALSNVFADLLSVVAFGLVVFFSRKQIAVLKSFMDTIVYGLSDSAKAFIIILSTDIFVGFHSPHGWEVLLEAMAEHLGVAANESLIFLFIATVPVVMDTIFKYWIFRYLSRMSPSTVATLKEMDD
jgi:CemA family